MIIATILGSSAFHADFFGLISIRISNIVVHGRLMIAVIVNDNFIFVSSSIIVGSILVIVLGNIDQVIVVLARCLDFNSFVGKSIENLLNGGLLNGILFNAQFILIIFKVTKDLSNTDVGINSISVEGLEMFDQAYILEVLF